MFQLVGRKETEQHSPKWVSGRFEHSYLLSRQTTFERSFALVVVAVMVVVKPHQHRPSGTLISTAIMIDSIGSFFFFFSVGKALDRDVLAPTSSPFKPAAFHWIILTLLFYIYCIYFKILNYVDCFFLIIILFRYNYFQDEL